MWGRFGLDSRLRLHGGRLCAGTTERGMGMTERVSTRRGKFQTCPYVRGSIGIMEGRDGRFANRPYEERRDIEHGRWVLRVGEWMDSRLRLHGGRLCAGTTGGDVGMRGEGEHEKGQV